mgnify:CR=1 FL=1
MLLTGCESFAPPDPGLVFKDRAQPGFQMIHLVSGRSVLVAETGNGKATPVLMIHGSPGAWNDFAHVMADEELAASAHLIAVDRVGWGGSADGGLETGLEVQAAALQAVLEQIAPGRPAIIVGHSYGGPVAVRLAIDYPGSVRALILVAPSIDPELENPTWLQKLGRTRVVRPFVPDLLLRADEEIKPLKPQLEAMLPLWSRLTMPVLVIQGDDDSLVPPGNADFALRMLSSGERANSVIVERIADQGHLIPWQRPDLIVKGAQRFLDR